jgi:putative ABC transport system substrate-binding protein
VHDTAFAGISQAALKNRKPLFSFISAKVLNSGAALAVSRDYEQAGRDMARLAQRVMRGESTATIPFQLVSRTLLVIKPANAALYGLTIPAELLARADQIVK